jgi:hypothetical protein
LPAEFAREAIGENQGQLPNFQLGSIGLISSAVLELRLLSLIFPLRGSYWGFHLEFARLARREGVRDGLLPVAVIALASLAVRSYFAMHLDIFQDEAIYWWPAVREANFCPHPPMMQWLTRLGLALLGDTAPGIRLGSLLAGTAAIFMIYAVARRFYDRRAGVWAAALFAACPLYLTVGALATPDALLAFWWMLFLYACHRAHRADSLFQWTAAGVVLAAGLYTKYMMALAVPAVFLAVMAESRSWRSVFRFGPWLATAVGLALFVPVFVAWNQRHDWVALKYHLESRHEWRLSLQVPAIYFLGHLSLLSPVLLAGVWIGFAAAWRAWRGRADANAAWLLAFGLVPIVVFAAPSLFTRREMIREHWDAFGYAVGMIALASLAGHSAWRAGARRRTLAASALVVAVLISGVVLVGARWPGLPVRAGLPPPTRQMLGWSEVAAAIKEVRRQPGRGNAFLLANSFPNALLVGYHLQQREAIFSFDHKRNVRYGMLDSIRQWGIGERDMFDRCRGRDAIFVHEFRADRSGREEGPARLYRIFDSVEPAREVDVVYGGKRVKHFGLFYCRRLRG